MHLHAAHLTLFLFSNAAVPPCRAPAGRPERQLPGARCAGDWARGWCQPGRQHTGHPRGQGSVLHRLAHCGLEDSGAQWNLLKDSKALALPLEIHGLLLQGLVRLGDRVVLRPIAGVPNTFTFDLSPGLCCNCQGSLESGVRHARGECLNIPTLEATPCT